MKLYKKKKCIIQWQKSVSFSQALHGNSLSLLHISLIKGKSIQQTLKRLLSEALLISNVRLLKHDTQDFLGGGGKTIALNLTVLQINPGKVTGKSLPKESQRHAT